MRKLLPLLTILGVILCGARVQAASLESYFPLKEGMVWEFQYKIFELNSPKEIETAKSVKKNFPLMNIKGTKAIPQEFSYYQPRNVLKHEVTSFIAKDKTGFFVIARQSSKDKEPQILPDKFYILRSPVIKGDTWKQIAEGFILQDTVLATDGAVRVPAGQANHCIVIRRHYFDRQDLETPFQETTFWYAPNVGNVKVVTKNFRENKEIVQELISFQK